MVGIKEICKCCPSNIWNIFLSYHVIQTNDRRGMRYKWTHKGWLSFFRNYVNCAKVIQANDTILNCKNLTVVIFLHFYDYKIFIFIMNNLCIVGYFFINDNFDEDNDAKRQQIWGMIENSTDYSSVKFFLYTTLSQQVGYFSNFSIFTGKATVLVDQHYFFLPTISLTKKELTECRCDRMSAAEHSRYNIEVSASKKIWKVDW